MTWRCVGCDYMTGKPELASAHRCGNAGRWEHCTCGSGAHPRRCELHPGAFAEHVAGLNAENATCAKCSTPLPTGDDEPCSGLCPTCEEVEADKQAAHDRHDAAVDARRTAEECAYDAERDDSLEQLLWPVRNRNEFEG